MKLRTTDSGAVFRAIFRFCSCCRWKYSMRIENCRKWWKSAIVYYFRHGWTTLTYCFQFELNGNVQKWRKSKVHEHVMMMIRNMRTVSYLFLIFRVLNYKCECVCVCAAIYSDWMWFRMNVNDLSMLKRIDSMLGIYQTIYLVRSLESLQFYCRFTIVCLCMHRCKGNIELLKTISN